MKSIVKAVLIVLIAASVFTTCDTPMGMGDEIDFIPPVLTLEPKPPKPMFVKLGAQLTGTVTDNDAVDRVILRDSTTGKEIFRAELLSNNRWRINLDFSAEQNGQTIQADVVAFDRAGNSGAESIASVVLSIDIRPPVVEDIWIQRTSVKTADIEKYTDLKELEETDPNAELTANVNRYQNGAFHIKAKLSEKETRIESVFIKFYDSGFPDTELLSIQPDSGSSGYNPQWLVTEDMLLDAGASKLPLSNYKADYKNNNKRYYYRLRITASDNSGNESEDDGEGFKIIEDQGYFCLWQKADYPKGFLDPIVVGGGTDIIMTKGSSLPAIFFDDDKVEWAYATLFTKEQWEGANDIADSGVKITGSTDNEKFEFIKNKLLGGQTVYNWRYDSTRAKSNSTSEPVKNLIPAPTDEKIHYVITGNDPVDYGDFVFVTLVKDSKQPPHNSADYPDVIRYRKYNVNLIDENEPLIVFDKTTEYYPVGSPEENTFPSIDKDGNFKIHGYTLREDKSEEGLNYVKKFGLAWIPFNIRNEKGGPEENINVVKKALAGEKEEGKIVEFPAGVQYWDLTDDIMASNETDTIAGINFKRQRFSKTFSILGGQDDKKAEYKNFYYNNELENTTKLFVFYAEDNMGHAVYTQFYLLGNKTPPSISIYDITDKIIMPTEPPNVYDYSPNGVITDGYKAARKTYNENSYITLRTASFSLTDTDRTEAYKVYPRGTTVKLWANASATGDLSIKEIKMEDITYKIEDGEKYPELGFYKDTDYEFSYVEFFPEVSQRVFLFTATDSLGNVARVQRTIAIASAATLTSITTAKQNGTYPMGENIQLKANFDGMIKLRSNETGKRPKLNILYNLNNETTFTIGTMECEPLNDTELANGTLSLVFNFLVPINAQGRIETIYFGIPNKPDSSIDRPITLVNKDDIIDAVRGDVAYTPGNVTGFVWSTPAYSLQYDADYNVYGKNIRLDGIAPVINAAVIKEIKTAYETSKYYLKSGDTLSIELTASKNLKVTGDTPSLRFRIQKPNNGGYSTYYEKPFEYRKVTGNKILFTLDVNSTNIQDKEGRITDVTLFNFDKIITDDPGNVIVSNNSYLTTLMTNSEIYFDLTPPVKPVTTLTPTGGGTAVDIGSGTTTLEYNKAQYMSISDSLPANEPYGIVKKQYSLDGGLKWTDYPTPESGWTSVTGAPDPTGYLYISNGTWNLRTRYIDKAGNEGATTDRSININNVFPKLLGVNVVQPNATYIGGQTLQFKLDFDDVVNYPVGATLTLENTSTVPHNTDSTTSPSYQIIVSPAAAGSGRTVTFTWNLTENTKDMLNGLKITAVNISGFTDRFGNIGPTGVTLSTSSPYTVTVNGTSVGYDFSKVIVSTIKPKIRSREPQSAQGRTGNITAYTTTADQEAVTSTTVANGSISADNKTIKLNFSKPIQKGNGTITIRPHAGYAIPAVFEHEGYYVTYTYDANGNITAETKSSSAGTDKTYVSGFYDVFNSVGDAQKTTLIGSTSMSLPALSNLTGLSVGPYLKTTHGLKQGAGYSGNYGNLANGQTQANATIALPGNNAPGTRDTNRMVPDVETKWVLLYSNTYNDLFSTTVAEVTNIRNVLNAAKWRWQEIAVTSTNVTTSGNSVTITLPEPLLPGLQWDVYYPEGTFTDEAGNKAAKSGNFNENTTVTSGTNTDYWFWSKGVQKPVIRVDRKSYDARPGGNANYSGDSFSNGSTYSNATTSVNGTIAGFNTINYRISSETPQARLFYNTLQGSAADGSSVTAAWTGNAVTANAGKNITANANILWQGPKNNIETIGTWAKQNLIFRSSQNGAYNIMEEGGNVAMNVGGSDAAHFAANNMRFYGFRSYNKDATYAELNGLTVPNTAGTDYQASLPQSFTFDPMEASKSYVVAQARIDHTTTGGTYGTANAVSSLKGYEGVFRTVVAMNQSGLNNAGSNGPAAGTNWGPDNLPMMISGTNVRSGLPTVTGFPLKDGVHRNDSRYMKVFYRDGKQFYWVTTEIVSSWVIQLCGRGDGTGSYSRMGDLNDWISAGYGDLSYALNLATWGD